MLIEHTPEEIVELMLAAEVAWCDARLALSRATNALLEVPGASRPSYKFLDDVKTLHRRAATSFVSAREGAARAAARAERVRGYVAARDRKGE
jgi:hypothetical protein